MLVTFICYCGIARASAAALGRDLSDLAAVLQVLGLHVVRALRHGLRLAQRVVALIATSHYASVDEPVPGRADLTAVAAH